jgi:hypothetical protein
VISAAITEPSAIAAAAGLSVTLLPWPEQDSVTVSVLTDTGESLEFLVMNESLHFAYLPLQAAA